MSHPHTVFWDGFTRKREGRRHFFLREKHEKDCGCLQVGGRAERSPTPIVDKVRTGRGRRKRRRKEGGRREGGGG